MSTGKIRLFFAPNIGTSGRVARGAVGVISLGAAWVFRDSFWLLALLLGSGAFTLFEAFRGWCVARACGLKTPM